MKRKEKETTKDYFLNKLESEVQEHKERYFCFARVKVLLTILLMIGVGTTIYCWDEIKFYINMEALLVLFAIIIVIVSLGLLFFPLDYFYRKKNKIKFEVD